MSCSRPVRDGFSCPVMEQVADKGITTDVRPAHLSTILSSCINLRRVGVAGHGFFQMCPVAEAMLFSLRSLHISVIYLEIIGTLRTLQVDQEWNDEGWRNFEDFLCRLADERFDNGQPLTLELGIWRNPLLKMYGPLDPGTILPRFRERGLIRFTDPPEDPDYAGALDYKYSSDSVVRHDLSQLAALLAGFD